MSCSHSESPTGWPCAVRNVKHMPPPITTSSTTPSSASITLSLSLTFEPPSTATNGRGGVLAQAEQHLDLRRQQPARRRGHELRRADDRGVRAVRGAERVVDVGVDALDQRRHEGRVVAVSPGSKRRFSSSSTPGASSARRARIGATEYFGSGAPFGRPRWVAVTTVAPRSLQPVDRRQGGADAEVVGDGPVVVERDVEVGAQQDALAVQVAERARSSSVGTTSGGHRFSA